MNEHDLFLKQPRERMKKAREVNEYDYKTLHHCKFYVTGSSSFPIEYKIVQEIVAWYKTEKETSTKRDGSARHPILIFKEHFIWSIQTPQMLKTRKGKYLHIHSNIRQQRLKICNRVGC